jgi:hypothetical protein
MRSKWQSRYLRLQRFRRRRWNRGHHIRRTAELDGKGNITGTMNISTKGTITTGVAVTGTYTQASDCIGTIGLEPSGFAAIDFNTYAVNANKELLLIDTVGGTTVGGNIQ